MRDVAGEQALRNALRADLASFRRLNVKKVEPGVEQRIDQLDEEPMLGRTSTSPSPLLACRLAAVFVL